MGIVNLAFEVVDRLLVGRLFIEYSAESVDSGYLYGVICYMLNNQTQNWLGHGESDCLIKTKHCDGW